MDKYPEFTQVVLFCCFGKSVINDLPSEKFFVVNDTNTILDHNPPTLCCEENGLYLMEFTFGE
jgi:hypothetical protein